LFVEIKAIVEILVFQNNWKQKILPKHWTGSKNLLCLKKTIKNPACLA
jgi:hypothetical protein